MLTVLLAAMASQIFPTGTQGPIPLEGRCIYPPEVAEKRDGAVLALCDRLTLEIGQEGADFDFAQASWGSMLRFSGERSGERAFAVRRLRSRNGEWRDANGTCELFYRDDTVSTVACYAVARGRTYAANFVVSRL